MERFHSEWTMPGGSPHRGENPPSPEQPFGERNAHKARKTIFGLALLILLSLMFYEFNGNTLHSSLSRTTSQDAGSATSR